jgi:hypothetical protein
MKCRLCEFQTTSMSKLEDHVYSHVEELKQTLIKMHSAWHTEDDGNLDKLMYELGFYLEKQ